MMILGGIGPSIQFARPPSALFDGIPTVLTIVLRAFQLSIPRERGAFCYLFNPFSGEEGPILEPGLSRASANQPFQMQLPTPWLSHSAEHCPPFCAATPFDLSPISDEPNDEPCYCK